MVEEAVVAKELVEVELVRVALVPSILVEVKFVFVILVAERLVEVELVRVPLVAVRLLVVKVLIDAEFAFNCVMLEEATVVVEKVEVALNVEGEAVVRVPET